MPNSIKYACILLMLLISSYFLASHFQLWSPSPITREVVASAEKLIGLTFTDAKRDSMLDGLHEQLKNYENIRKIALPNNFPPAFLFNPIPVGFEFEKKRRAFKQSKLGKVPYPRSDEELSFMSVAQLGKLIKSRKITSEELTRVYIDRLKRFGPTLECIITLTEERALEQTDNPWGQRFFPTSRLRATLNRFGLTGCAQHSSSLRSPSRRPLPWCSCIQDSSWVMK